MIVCQLLVASYLAAGGFGQLVDATEGFGDLVCGEMFFAECEEFPLVEGFCARGQDQLCTGELSILGMGFTVDKRLGNCWKLVEHLFDLLGEDLHASEIDDRFQATDQGEASIGVQFAQVARVKPPVNRA
jgi:hypothetical protein